MSDDVLKALPEAEQAIYTDIPAGLQQLSPLLFREVQWVVYYYS